MELVAPKKTDAYLSHSWNTCTNKRRHHGPAQTVNEQLIRRGFTTWFDHEENGASHKEMDEGIDHTKCFLVFVDETYMRNIDVYHANDNCFYEFTKAVEKARRMLYLVMEENFENRDNWFGKLGEQVGFSVFVSMW